MLYVTTGNPAFCLFLYLTGAHFWGELQHNGDVSEQKIKCWPIRIREIGGVRLSDGRKTDYRWIIWKIRPVILFQKKIDRKRRLPRTHLWFSGLSFFFLYRLGWWLLKVQKWMSRLSPSSRNCFYCFFIFWFKGLSLKTQIKIWVLTSGKRRSRVWTPGKRRSEFWRPVNGDQLVLE